MNTLCGQVKAAHDWQPEEKNSMRRLFEHALKDWPNLVHTLRETQGTLVFQAQRWGNYNWQSLVDFDLELVRLSNAGQFEEALTRTADKLKQAVEEFWPDCPLPSYHQFLTERLERQSRSSTPAAHPVKLL